MEVIANQWNEVENEVEEVGLQRRRGIKHSSSSSSTSSDENIQVKAGEILEFDEFDTKEKFEGITTEVNAEVILLHEDSENGTILPASDPPLDVDSTSLSNVTNESGTISIIQENGQERQELYLERVFEKPPTHGFYCPNCNSCIQKVYIQKEEWEQIIAQPQQVQPNEPIRCTSCFSFLIPIGSWLFPCLVSDENGALTDQGTGSSSKSRQPEVPEKKLKGSSQHEAPKNPDQSWEVIQSAEKGTSKSAVSITVDSGKQTLQIIEDVPLLGTGPQKLASEVQVKINGTGHGNILRHIPENTVQSQDSSDYSNATSQDTILDQKKGQVTQKKKHFWSHWTVRGGASVASIPKNPETSSAKKGDWKVITPSSHTTKPKQPEIGFSDKQQPEHIEVKVDIISTEGVVPTETAEVVPSEPELTPFLVREVPVPERERESSKTWEILKSIVYGGLHESLASLSVVTSAASADATTLNIVALALANLIGGLFVLAHNLGELKGDKPKRADNNEADAKVDHYNEILGKRENFYLHAFIAILSFIVFGLVPPLVYGFSFRESDDKDFKLAAVAGASLICITLLSIAKAYIKRPNSFLTYFQTVLYYVSTGAVASVLSYLAGDLVKKLFEKFGWFEPVPSNFGMQIKEFGVQQPRWGSF